MKTANLSPIGLNGNKDIFDNITFNRFDGLSKIVDDANLFTFIQKRTESSRKHIAEFTYSKEDDLVVCLCCGIKMKSITKHLKDSHKLTTASYREMFPEANVSR